MDCCSEREGMHISSSLKFVFLGLVATVPVTALVACLLMSADEGMENMFTGITDWLYDLNAAEIMIKLLLTLPCSLYLFGMLASYAASTIYHTLPRRSIWKERLRHWDHAAIYWHIAGSYSPLTLIALREQGYWGWSLFSFVWACAIAGTIVSFIKLKEHSNVETFCYVGMGLSVLIAFKPLLDSVSTAAVIWIIAEGVCYITGALFYSFNKKRYMHSVFHFFVLAGSICHIIAVWDVLMEYL